MKHIGPGLPKSLFTVYLLTGLFVALRYAFNLGYAWEQEGNFSFALDYYHKALELFKKSGVKAQINSVEWKIKTHS